MRVMMAASYGANKEQTMTKGTDTNIWGIHAGTSGDADNMASRALSIRSRFSEYTRRFVAMGGILPDS